MPVVDIPKKIKNKLAAVNNDIEMEVQVQTEPKKQKKNKEKIEAVIEPVVEVPEKKKSKKRKLLEDSLKTDEEVKPKSKKLNILTQIEDPNHNRHLQSRDGNSKNVVEQPFSVALPSQKLKKVMPKSLEVEKKKRKKGAKKVYAEPQDSLPRPVWTSSGVFIEEPVSPYKFTSTSYVPISTGSTSFGVVAFEGKKKKKVNAQQQPPARNFSGDFKTQAMNRNKKNRDGSNKNMHGLLGIRNTL